MARRGRRALPEKIEVGFIKWNGTNFKVQIEKGVVWGHRRKAPIDGRDGPIAYAIDIWAKFDGETYNLGTLSYMSDPADKPKSRDKDIVKHVNEFIGRLEIGWATLTELRKRAEKPCIHITRLETIDLLLMKLREYRDTAIRCGGTRTLGIEGDREGDPMLHVEIDLTRQALILDGHVPPLHEGVMYDDPKQAKKGGTSRTIKKQIDPANLDSLLKQLEAAKEAGNKAVARKLRAQLRSMGHRGGLRKNS